MDRDEKDLAKERNKAIRQGFEMVSRAILEAADAVAEAVREAAIEDQEDDNGKR